MAGSTTVRATGNKAIDGLLSGLAWDGPLSFGFPTNAADYGAVYGSGEPMRGFAALSVTTRDTVRAALLGTPNGSGKAALSGMGVAQFTLLDIAEVASTADIRLAESSRPPTAWAYMPGTGIGGDVWFGTAYAGTIYDYRNPILGNYAHVTVLHELGHALGLKHAQEAGGVAGTAVPSAQDSLEFTVMTYRSYVGAPTTGYSFEQWGAPQSYMMLDIAALQAMYGADFGTRSGDTTYSWNPLTGEMSVDGNGQGLPGGNRVFLTLWDGGGRDTYDLSNYGVGVIVDLAPGGWSVLAAGQLAKLGSTAMARGNVFNAMQYHGDTRSLIEDAIGGTGNDTLHGNAAGNRLAGGAGNDSMAGGAGNDSLAGFDGADTLEGGAGSNTLSGGTGDDTYIVASGTDLLAEAFGEGTDAVRSGLAWTLGANLENLVLTGRADVAGTGNTLNNRIEGNAGANRLAGAAGNDTLLGGDGSDTLDGGTGSNSLAGGGGDDTYLVSSTGDLVREEAGGGTDLVRAAVDWTLGANLENLTLTGTAGLSGTGNALHNVILGNAGANLLSGGDGNDSLAGGEGSDTLVGGAGRDTLSGNLGDDTYLVDSATVTLIESAGQGTDTVRASLSSTLGANFEVLVLTGSAALNGTGNAMANMITGNAGANLLAGGDGADTIAGGTGADTLQGGAGADLLNGGAGADVFRFLRPAEGGDIITDFAGAADRFEFSSAGFGAGLQAGMDLLAAGRLQLNEAGTAVGTLAQFVYGTVSHILAWDGNGAGIGGVTEIALLRDRTSIAAGDFIVIA